MGPEWTHIVGAIAALVAAVAAVLTFFVVAGAVVVAWIQLNQAKSNTKALLMADLARRWDEELLLDSRFRAAGMSPDDLLNAIEGHYNAADRAYYELIRVPNFFEDLGLMAREGTISEGVVRKLFAGPVLGKWELWKPTIDYLREVSGRRLMYEHFQWLSGRM